MADPTSLGRRALGSPPVPRNDVDSGDGSEPGSVYHAVVANRRRSVAVVLDHFRQLSSRLAQHAGTPREHAAVVDLLVLTVYSDRRITQGEIDALEQFDVEHSDWDSGVFSVQQYLPEAVAKVRSALDVPGGADRLLGEAAAALSDAEVRAFAVDACRAVASAGGAAPAEEEFVERVRSALASGGG